MRRLLSLDYVIEHTGLPWLPTEHEKVAAFEALGIERGLLPVQGLPGSRRKHTPLLPGQLPVALVGRRAPGTRSRDRADPSRSSPSPALRGRRTGPWP